MSMNIIKRTTLATAVLAACGMGVSGQAAAEVYAGSSLSLNSLNVTFSQPASGVDYSFFTTDAAQLNTSPTAGGTTNCSGSTPGTTTCGTLPSDALDGLVANAAGGTVTRSAGDFSLLGPNATDTYANSDSAILQAELLGAPTTTANAVAEAQLAGTGSASASTTTQSNSTISFSFTAPTTGAITVSYNMTPFLQVALNTARLINATGQASTTANFVLSNASTGATVDSSQPTNLNLLRNIGANGTDFTLGGTAIADSFTGTNLVAGVKYILNLHMQTAVSLTQTVPDPATPALMALGLVVMGATLRRRQAKGRRQNKA